MEGSRRAMDPLALEFMPSEPYQSTVDTSTKHDYFSPLPPELLDIIFDEAHSQAPLTGPISSSLTPFWRARKFEKVEIEGYEQLASFANNVSVATLSLVKTFYITVPPFTPGFTARIDSFDELSLFKEMKVPAYFREDTIRSLFQNLPNVEILSLTGSSYLARLILSPAIAITSFPELDSLSIKSTFEGIPDPFHSAHFTSLAFYDKLMTLEVGVYRKTSSLRPSTKSLPALRYQNRTRLSLFQLAGPISGKARADLLLFLFPAFEMTIIKDSAHPSNIEKILKPVFCATSKLVINARPQNPLSVASIAPFRRLEVLGLFGDFVPPGPEFYNHLRTLPLKALQFAAGNELSSNELISLISGPKRINTLKTIVIDEMMVGRNLFGHQIKVPAFTPAFTREGLARLVIWGEVEGVKVIGETVEALRSDGRIGEERGGGRGRSGRGRRNGRGP